jgi:hypothetical protein
MPSKTPGEKQPKKKPTTAKKNSTGHQSREKDDTQNRRFGQEVGRVKFF